MNNILVERQGEMWFGNTKLTPGDWIKVKGAGDMAEYYTHHSIYVGSQG